jgi:predicted Zn-dependent protease
MRLLLTTVFIGLSFFVSNGFSQGCSPPQIVFNTKTENIFSPEQEMFLGDAMSERVRRDYRVIDDEQVNAYLQRIGDRISKHLPESGIRFRFEVVDTNDTNAYAMAGGRIFVTRKMISFVRNEDELAGVLGHELGHAVVRHHAIDISRYFKQLLSVTSVGDRRDVFEKYNRFLETYRTKRVKFSGSHEGDQQIEADRIGLFAAFAAGYDPNGFTDFWKRLTDAKKKSFLGEIFGSKTLADKRLKEMIDAMKKISPGCVEKLPASTGSDFDKWRAFVRCR